MAAAASCRQALSLLDCVGVQHRTCLRERPFNCKSCVLQARPLALVSALPELQHVKTQVKAAPECYENPESEEPVKRDRNKMRRKGRTKKTATTLPSEILGNGDSTRGDPSQTSSQFLSLVRSVVNAEDSTSEGRNRGVASSEDSITLPLRADEGNREENSFVLCQMPLEAKSDESMRPLNLNIISKKNLGKTLLESTETDEQSDLPNNAAGFSDDATNASSVTSTSGDRSSQRTHSRISTRKPHRRRRKKDEGHLIVQSQDFPLVENHQNIEFEAHVDAGIKPARLEHDGKLGEAVLGMSKSQSNSTSIAEELAKVPSGMAISKDVVKMTKFLDKNTVIDQSSTSDHGLSEQYTSIETISKKLVRDFNMVRQSALEASDVEEGLDNEGNIIAEDEGKDSANGLKTRARMDTNHTATDGSDRGGILQGEDSRLLRNWKRSKRSRKQHSAEHLNAEGDVRKFSESDHGMCTVCWLVETQLEKNQKLFLVGSDSYLGAWEPSMAISFTFCKAEENTNLWQGHCQVPYGTRSEYNYFVRIGNRETDPIVWRPGLKLHLVVPFEESHSQGTDVAIKDILDFNVANKLPALLWNSLQNEIGFPTELGRFFGDEFFSGSIKQSELANLEDDSRESISMQEDMNIQNFLIEQNEDPQHVVDVMDVRSDALPRHTDEPVTKVEEQTLSPVKLTPKLRKLIKKRVFPREEPWLMESMFLYEKSDVLKSPAAGFEETGQEAEDGHGAVVEKSPEKEEILTEILINSSKCTMERIAILENGKLVELLLKPVNSDINVGNVYLGIVKKLLPGMTGVFVDIGHPRVALLTITKNTYPFTFPPIASTDNPSGDNIVNGEENSTGKLGVSTVELGQDSEKSVDLVEEEWESEDEDEDADEEEDAVAEATDDVEELAGSDVHSGASHDGDLPQKVRGRKLLLGNDKITRPITVNFGQRFTKWRKVEEGMRIIVQVKREPLGKKGPKVCAFPQLSSRFWVLGMGGKSTGVSKKIHGPERKRLKDLANLFRKPGFDLTVRTEAAGQSQEDLEKDMLRLFETWKDIMERAEVASFATENGQDGAVPALLHRAMGQTLSIVRDFFAEKVQRMVVDSAQTYHEVTSYLQEVAPQLQNRVELYTGTSPIFDVFNLEADINKILHERVQLPNGAYIVIEETEALVTIDVNGGAGMLGKSMKSAAILEANLSAARQIAAELRLRDIGGIIVVDFIDMDEDEHESLVYEEMRNAIQSDRSIIYISEISELGLMELTRRRVRPSVTFMISDPCSCCRGTGRVEALETTFSKIERAILRLVANHPENIHFDGRTWKKVLLRVDPVMFEFLTRKQRAAQLSSSLKVYIILKVGREMSRGSFELSELNLGSEKRFSSMTGQQPRSLRKAVRLGIGGKKDTASRT